jgi:hypothetical protein
VSTSVEGLPDPSRVAHRLKHTVYAADVIQRANRVKEHQFDILGITIETGPDIRWRRDYVSGRETGVAFFRTIPYLDATRAGDHKVIWELNRHQHLVLLAQAYLFSHEKLYLIEIESQLESWLDQNPVHASINWASALEVAFRALSWMWLWLLVGRELAPALRKRFLVSLHQHGRHLEFNLSYYFSRNTHLLGEAVALHAIGKLFPNSPHSQKWRQTGDTVVREELAFQVLPDGAHFEQSSYYHVYALDFFTLHFLLAGRPPEFVPVLERMANYLDTLMGIPRAIPLIGDDDGGRLFHPYGTHTEYGRASLATASALLGGGRWSFREEDVFPQAAWWVGVETLPQENQTAYQPQSRAFRDSGLVEMGSGQVQAIFDAGPFGPGTGGHSHSDTLSILVRRGSEDILVDAGTYTYVGDAEWRNRFRSSAFHNTVGVDQRDQGEPSGPFGWRTKPRVALLRWDTTPDQDLAAAECAYAEIVHRRTVLFLKREELLFVVDEVTAGGDRTVEQFWHVADPRHTWRLSVADDVAITIEPGWRSRALGNKEPTTTVVRARVQSSAQNTIAVCIDCSGTATATALRSNRQSEGWLLRYRDVSVIVPFTS